jgi:glycine/D-amino acid oxidase-like deaminating enzyme
MNGVSPRAAEIRISLASSEKMKIAVLGGGCVGLTTALIIQEKLRNAHIDVIAADFEQTTSHVAAGIFRVGDAYSGPTEAITRFAHYMVILS